MANLYLQSLEINNFQKHKHLVINFTEGVNVVYGATDAGKSCVRRAIEWLHGINTPSGLRRQGTKQTSVKGTYDTGEVVERIRSASINRYIIHKNDEEIKFDAIGKTLPEEIKKILKIEPINIDGEDIYLNSSPQITLPFLFDKSPTFRMKLFNKLTGNDVLDKLFVQFNKDILNIGREHKRETAQAESQEKMLVEIEEKKDKMETVHVRVTKSVHNLQQLNEKYSKLLGLLELVTNNHVTIVDTKRNLSLIKISDLSEIKGLMKKVERLDSLNASENDTERTKNALSKVRGQLVGLCVPELNHEGLTHKIERADALKILKTNLDNGQDKCYTLGKKLEDVRKHTINCKDQYKELLKSVQICPTCGNKITEECLKEIKL